MTARHIKDSEWAAAVRWGIRNGLLSVNPYDPDGRHRQRSRLDDDGIRALVRKLHDGKHWKHPELRTDED